MAPREEKNDFMISLMESRKHPKKCDLVDPLKTKDALKTLLRIESSPGTDHNPTAHLDI